MFHKPPAANSSLSLVHSFLVTLFSPSSFHPLALLSSTPSCIFRMIFNMFPFYLFISRLCSHQRRSQAAPRINRTLFKACARVAGIHGDFLNLHTEAFLSLHTGGRRQFCLPKFAHVGLSLDPRGPPKKPLDLTLFTFENTKDTRRDTRHGETATATATAHSHMPTSHSHIHRHRQRHRHELAKILINCFRRRISH